MLCYFCASIFINTNIFNWLDKILYFWMIIFLFCNHQRIVIIFDILWLGTDIREGQIKLNILRLLLLVYFISFALNLCYELTSIFLLILFNSMLYVRCYFILASQFYKGSLYDICVSIDDYFRNPHFLSSSNYFLMYRILE